MKEKIKCQTCHGLFPFKEIKTVGQKRVQTYCIECFEERIAKQKEWQKNNRDKMSANVRAWQKRNPEKMKVAARKQHLKIRTTEKYKKRRRESYYKWRKLFPEKEKASKKIQQAVKKGVLKREPCVICKSNTNIHGHHFNYSLPMQVVWLCVTHHMKLHSETPPKGVSLLVPKN